MYAPGHPKTNPTYYAVVIAIRLGLVHLREPIFEIEVTVQYC